jgi:curved DNA-binding protein CbpA
MSESHLSDDLRSWPADPYKLIGVKRSIDTVELKRAYTRLIKRFKPEQFPEHFRTLREAYDSISSRLEYEAMYDQRDIESADLSTALPISLHIEKPDSNNPEIPIAEVPAFVRPLRIDDIGEAITLAANGQFDTALEKLRLMQARGEQLSLACALEYWIAKLSDPNGSSAATVLQRQIDSGYWFGHSAEAAVRDLSTSPQAMLESTIRKLVTQFDNNSFYQFLLLRWEAAHRAKSFELICDDCKVLYEHFFDDLPFWLTISHSAIHHLLWAQNLSTVQYGMQAAADLERNYMSLPSFLRDQMNVTTLIAFNQGLFEYMKLPGANKKYWDMCSYAWNRIEPETTKLLTNWMKYLSDDINRGLVDFVALAKCNPSIVQFLESRCLSISNNEAQQEADRKEKFIDQATDLAIRRFLSSLRSLDYRLVRPDLIHFCINEGLTIETLTYSFSVRASKIYSKMPLEFIEHMRADIPGSCLVRIVNHYHRISS